MDRIKPFRKSWARVIRWCREHDCRNPRLVLAINGVQLDVWVPAWFGPYRRLERVTFFFNMFLPPRLECTIEGDGGVETYLSREDALEQGWDVSSLECAIKPLQAYYCGRHSRLKAGLLPGRDDGPVCDICYPEAELCQHIAKYSEGEPCRSE